MMENTAAHRAAADHAEINLLHKSANCGERVAPCPLPNPTRPGRRQPGDGIGLGLRAELQWREFPFEWLEPEFYRVHRVFEGGPFQEMRAGLELKALPKDRCQAVFYSEWTPRGMAGRGLARSVLGPKRAAKFSASWPTRKNFWRPQEGCFPGLPAQPVQ
jgi:hypothetical protein